jgi:AraC-like DNA-binding protein
MIFNLLNTIILLGSIQGFIFSGLLYTMPGRQLPQRLLAILLLLLSVASFHIYLSESNAPWQVGVVLSLLPTMLFMIFGPLLYCYVRSVLDSSYRLTGKRKLHFAPIIIDLLPAMTAWVLTSGYAMNAFTQQDLLRWGDIIDQYNSYADVPRWLSVSCYLVLTKIYLRRFSGELDLNKRSRYHHHLQWLNRFVNIFLIFQLVWFAFLVPYILPATRFVLLDKVGYYPIYLPLAVLIYALGIKGYLHARLFGKSAKESSIQLSDQETLRLAGAIRNAMEQDRLFLEPELNLATLVNYVGSDQRTISHVLNHQFAKSFNAFVNQYRVEEVKRRLKTADHETLTLSGIAYECGFNSQSTFQRVFKQITNSTPKQYLLEHRKVNNR